MTFVPHATQLNNTYKKVCEQTALFFIAAAAFSVGLSTTLTTLTYLMAFLLILISGQWRLRLTRVKNNPALLSFWILFALYLVGLTDSVSPWPQAFKDLHKMHWLLITPFLAMVICDDAWRRRIIHTFLVAMLITLLLSYAKIFGADLGAPFPNIPGVNVFFGHIVQTFFLNIAAFIAGYRCLFERKGRSAYFIFFLLVTINVLFLEESITGYLTFFILLGCLLFFRFRKKGLLIAAALILLLMGTTFLTSPALHFRLKDIHQNVHQYHAGQTMTSIGLRLAMWNNALILIKKHPWFGYGTGGIYSAMQQNLTPSEIKKTQLIDYVEYTPLNFILEFGVFGFAIFLLALALQLKSCFSLPTEYKHLMLAFLISYLAASLINCFFVSFCETHLYSLLAAVCFSALNSNKTSRAHS